jgi:hypothetical protein
VNEKNIQIMKKVKLGKFCRGKHTDYVIFVVKIHIMGKFCRWSTQIEQVLSGKIYRWNFCCGNTLNVKFLSVEIMKVLFGKYTRLWKFGQRKIYNSSSCKAILAEFISSINITWWFYGAGPIWLSWKSKHILIDNIWYIIKILDGKFRYYALPWKRSNVCCMINIVKQKMKSIWQK